MTDSGKNEFVVGRITAIDGDSEPDKHAEAYRKVMAQLPQMIASATIYAQVRRANYLAYIKEGFTEAQALELCKTL